MTRKLFGFLVKLLQNVQSTDAKIALTKYCGILASKNYCGTFRSFEIEEFLTSLSQPFSKQAPPLKVLNTKQLVHIFTTTYNTGGHTRFLENLVQLDDTYTHHLLITNQGKTPPRTALIELILSKGGKIHFIKEADLKDQVQDFTTFVSENASSILLHIHQHDFLPSIALGPYKDQIDIHFFNHADHSFSYGCDISKSVINIREEAQKISCFERKQPNSPILPLPIVKNDSIAKEYLSIRTKYGISETDIVGVSIGNPFKFYTSEKHYFFHTIFKGLEQNPRLKIFIVGVDKSDFCKELGVIEHDRLVFLGILPDPSEVQFIADIIFDPMPLGSYTALLETSYYGAYPMVCYGTIPLFNLYNDESFKGRFTIDLNEKDYLEHLKALCDGKIAFNREEISTTVKAHHSGKEWLFRFYSIIENDYNLPPITAPSNQDLDRFYELNEPWQRIQYSTLSFFYENIHLFTRKEVLKIVLHLISNRYSVKETLGIIKKHMVNK